MTPTTPITKTTSPSKEFVIFDLDGTIADLEHRRHHVRGKQKDWGAFYDECDKDTPIQWVIQFMYMLTSHDFDIHIWSGRSEQVYEKTLDWLIKHRVPYNSLRMRPAGDFTQDHVMKEIWLHQLDKPPFCVFDDRDKVVEMWRRNDVPCLQVAPGDF